MSSDPIEVRGHDGIYFLVDPDTGDTRGTLLDEGGGWWRCRTPAGLVRRVYVGDVDEPALEAAERVG